MPEARTANIKPPNLSKDFTGKERARLQKEQAEALAARQDEVTLAHAAEQEAVENEVLDVTQNSAAPVVVDDVIVVEVDEADDPSMYEVIRVAEDVEDATIASHLGIVTYNFKAGRKYKVPANVAFVLREQSLIYDRA